MAGARAEGPVGAGFERELLSQVAKGDKGAFRTLYARFQRPLLGYILRFERNPAIAEELVNDVMLEVWRNAGEYEGRSTVATWVFGIARNKSLSQLRRKRDESLSEDDMAELEDPSASPETVAAQGHLATLVDRAMGHLTPEHREVLHLTYRQELSVQEISEITGVPTNTVKTRMFYARQRMKQLLADAGVMEVDP